MPWRLLRFVAVFAAFLAFVILNLDNRSDLSLGFVAFRDVPVFITASFAFVLGLVVALPFMIALWVKARRGAGGKSPGRAGSRRAGRAESQAPRIAPPAAGAGGYGVD